MGKMWVRLPPLGKKNDDSLLRLFVSIVQWKNNSLLKSRPQVRILLGTRFKLHGPDRFRLSLGDMSNATRLRW